jgi:E3 ubiquitin-protein ligase HERC2
VCGGKGDASDTAFAIGEEGEVFWWGPGTNWLFGHGDTQNQPSPKRVEALRGLRVTSVAVGDFHALALAEDGLVYAWGENQERAVFGNPHVERELPKPYEALRGVRVGSVAVGGVQSYAVADTGQVWAWGCDGIPWAPLGHYERMHCPLPKPIESLWGVKVDVVIASYNHTLALAHDGSVYAWGAEDAAEWGTLGLGASVSAAGRTVSTPQRISGLRVTCGLW